MVQYGFYTDQYQGFKIPEKDFPYAVQRAADALGITEYRAQVLPEDFNYAGVMSFAGAILSRKGEVKYAETPAPTLMLHGTSDALVNYRQIKFFNLGFFGGGKLVKRFEKFGYNYNMYHFLGYGHEIAGSMDTTFDIQLDFLQTNVIEGKRRIVEAWVDDPNVYKGTGVQSRKELYGN